MSNDTDPTPPPQPEQGPGPPDGRVEFWREVGSLPPIEFSRRAVRRIRVETFGIAALFAGVIVAYNDRRTLLAVKSRHVVDTPFCHAHPAHHGCMATTTAGTVAQVITVILLVGLGWALARDFGRMLAPMLERRVDPATAGTVGFLVRLVTLAAAVVLALHVAGVDTATLAIGASFTAVVFGLAAQQTLGNLIAGTVLLSARPFRVGERVRLQGGPLAGSIEGTATTLGLLYTTFATGEDHVLIPNSVVLGVSITPLREPDAVSLRARLAPGTTPLALQRVLDDGLTVPIRARPSITLEELDYPDVIVQISATPVNPNDGGKLAGELVQLVSSQVREGAHEAPT